MNFGKNQERKQWISQPRRESRFLTEPTPPSTDNRRAQEVEAQVNPGQAKF